MSFKQFNPGCCCENKSFQCKPCSCFTFYDPNSGKDTSNLSYNTNIKYSTYLLYQCYSGNSSPHNIGGVFSDTFSGYKAGDFVCYSGYFSSTQSFNTPVCTGFNLQGCSEYSSLNTCYGNPSGSNAYMDYYLTVYPDDGESCMPSMCLCGMGVCDSGNNSCIPVPYCPTKIVEKWDASLYEMFNITSVGNYTYVVKPCPYSFSDTPAYYTCKTTPCKVSDGECDYWIEPDLKWSNQLGRYTSWDFNGDNQFDIYATNITTFLAGSVVIPTYSINSGWNKILYISKCIYQKINLCEDNFIQDELINLGQGGWTNGWPLCSTEYCCYEGLLPPMYPQSDLSFDFSQDVVFNISNGFGGFYTETVTIAANLTLPLDKTSNPPGSMACGVDNVCYQNTCKSVTVTIPTAVTAHVAEVGTFYNGIGHVELISANAQYVGYKPNGVCIQAPGVTVKGTLCAGARAQIAFSPWGCSNLLPANGGIRSRRACFDSSNTFTGWADEIGSLCCGCDCSDNTCSYYFADINGWSTNGYAYGTVDLCNNIIFLTLYDSNLNEIGTLSV